MKPLTPTELSHLMSLRKTLSGLQQTQQFLHLPMPDYSAQLKREANSEDQHEAWVNGEWEVPTIKLGEDDCEDTLPGVGTDVCLGEEPFPLVRRVGESDVCSKKCAHGSECLMLKGHCPRAGHDTQHGCIFYDADEK